MNKFRKVIIYAVAIIAAVLSYTNALYSADHFVTDKLYNRLKAIPNDTVMIGIDEDTLEKYGNFTVWSREESANLLNYLFENEEEAPAVVGIDVMYIDGIDKETDSRLSEAAKKGTVVLATNVVYKTSFEKDDAGQLYYNSWNVDHVERPYKELEEVTVPGFSNPLMAKDGRVRYATSYVNYDGEKVYSFAHEIYRKYQEKRGLDVVEPKTNELNQFQFFYTGSVDEFPHFSWCDVMDGTIPKSAFKDKIVIIGARAAGFQDSYHAAVSRGKVMYGCEIHANIVHAYMNGMTAVEVPAIAMAVITAIILALIIFLGSKQKLLPFIFESVVIAALFDVLGIVLAGHGYVMQLLYVDAGIAVVAIYYVIEKYFIERLRRRKTLEVFKKYVAPQVVDDIQKTGDFKLDLGGESRDVAVLFVDIRGFTPMSEGLKPKEVVSILNEYLTLTTTSILKHKGTLDKFIGDATMAVFNAPFDQEDYIYEAVATAWDIKSGSAELAAKLMEQFGKTVSFGIGVNCGEAVVGNIGCDFRMDYTAIGDTVNTAARLESNAKPGEILISEFVYEAIKDRITVEEVGAIPLKGKSNKINVFRVIDIGVAEE